MKQNELLDDLEDFINCDWKEVHENFKKEEYQKEISEPVVPDFPVYREFYDLMVELVGDPQISPRLEYMIHRFVRNRSNKNTKGFERVWEFFTDPSRYKVYEQRCENCHTLHNVITKRQNIPRVNVDMWSHEQVVEMRSEMVACTNCGRPIMSVVGEVVGVFK